MGLGLRLPGLQQVGGRWGKVGSSELSWACSAVRTQVSLRFKSQGQRVLTGSQAPGGSLVGAKTAVPTLHLLVLWSHCLACHPQRAVLAILVLKETKLAKGEFT